MPTQAALELGELTSVACVDWADPGLQPGWVPLVNAFRASGEGARLQAFLQQRQAEGAIVYPQQPLRALALTAPEAVRVVILGQDPYHGPGQAEGLAFSVGPGVKPPPSLRNMFKELQRDLALPLPAHGSLVRWAEQGVLLLNTCLTVDAGQPGSHAGQGWEALTDAVIGHCSQAGSPKVFLLWGAHAQKKAGLIDAHRHAVLLANHPSPLSANRAPAPFMGCGHFGQANQWLVAQKLAPIRW
ncbi:MAG: uracil-DNA glycosylase [Hydrogenophaga sp.]|uniref:uracil-DNA glycosylase n=1 Tax=Hydrogenophaga sp. TaxID=1904254 RepID=UPI001BBA4C1D|nr:uracil-DNA glycosylase [Hydrogenophaga sp.]MBS3912219.1 uracil-DNA glycosylase [Hydrogenophaga sp.]MDO9147331.1 uracil-DNA glycosylase [Hydrogenophaga sp.]MDP2163428.1 uracil-DNA glycosylase [Hydrogenophaga sp.]MDP3476739.1 uracil-DNA glycosylase [Hydrogenophaga sp.]